MSLPAPASALDLIRPAVVETIDHSWVCDPRRLPLLPDEDAAGAYVRTVEALAAAGYGSYPDPAAGDGIPNGRAPLVVYHARGRGICRETHEFHELYLHLLCSMAQADGDVSSSEFALAMSTATRLADGNAEHEARYHALVAWRLRLEDETDPLTSLLARHDRDAALDVWRTLSELAWVDGYCHPAEARLLAEVERVLGIGDEA
jgi:hypothetical protein